MKRRVCALLCALLLLCPPLAPSRALTEGDIYFTSVNDTLLPLNTSSMPAWVNGALYVPASVFDKSSTGSNLALFYNYNRSAGMLTLYTIGSMLIFDLTRGTVYDQHSGENLSPRAVTRNGQIYLPVELVCDFFSLDDSYTYTQWGYLVRIKDGNSSLSDARFLDAAGTIMRERMEELMAAQKPPETTPKPPDASGGQQDPKPPGGDTTPPTPPDTPPETTNETQVCLAFRCTGGEGLAGILDALDRRQRHALFLFDAQTIRTRDDLVRRAVGSGHTVGLIGQTAEELADGNAALAHVARTAATVVLTDAEHRAELEALGWICWKGAAPAAPRPRERAASFAQRMTQNLGTSRRTVYLTLDDSDALASALGALLTRLENEKYTVITPLEPRL